MPLLIHQHLSGYIIVLNNDCPAQEDALSLLEYFGKIVTMQLKKSNLAPLSSFPFANMVTDIFHGNIRDDATLLLRLKSVDFRVLTPVILLILDGTQAKIKAGSASIKELIDQNFHSPKQLLYNEHLLVLLEGRESIYFSSDFEHHLSEKNLKLVASPCFYDLLQLKNFYQTGAKTLEIAHHLRLEQSILHSQKFKIQRMLYDLEKVAPLSEFAHQSILSMIAYDQENHTNYYQSLQVYLEEKQHISQAAQKLFIHRNTMMYRLDKIKELFSIHLDHKEELLEILLTIEIQQYLDNKNSKS